MSTQEEKERDEKDCGSFGRSNAKRIVAYPQDILLASTTLALTLSKGRSQHEIETLINLFNLTTNNLQAILAQVLINNRVPDNLETLI